MKAIIYCFIDGKRSNNLLVSAFYIKDKKILKIAGHISNNVIYAKHDIGITSNWKHEIYEKLFPNGYELQWINDCDLKKHPVIKQFLR
jgi:hypothetical protein